MSHVLVFDLGTSYFKASIFDALGSILGLQACPTPSTSPQAHQYEITPESFRESIEQLAKSLNQQHPEAYSQISALTFATQTNSFLLLDKNDDPLTPIIVWNDQRAYGDIEINNTLTQLEYLHDTTGIPALSPEFMVGKILWLQKHHPKVIDTTARICLLSDYFTLWFTGQHVTEAGAAGLTGLLNIDSLYWWADAIKHFEIPLEWLPSVARAGTDLGAICEEMAIELSLPQNCTFVVGCLDQYAGAIGSANIYPGGVSETTGTVLATVRCSDTHTSTKDVFIGPGYDGGIYFQMLFHETSANLLEYFRNCLSDSPSFADLDKGAQSISTGENPLQLPWRSNVNELKSRIHEWSTAYGTDIITRAILEGVGFSMHDQLHLLCGDHIPTSVHCVGGAARSHLWLQIKADIVNRNMCPIECPEPTSLGAAILALSVVLESSVEELSTRCVHMASPITPIIEHHTIYQSMISQ